jgi:hypothetical protein
VSVAVEWLVQFVSQHGAWLGLASLVAVAFILLVVSGAAGRITLFLEELE